jgi:hypothetical protein
MSGMHDDLRAVAGPETAAEVESWIEADPGPEEGARKDGGERTPAVLPWRWAEEIVASTPEEPDWILAGYLASGDKVMLAGRTKVGKSTWVDALVRAICAESPNTFLGRGVRGGPVVLVSEEGDGTLAGKLTEVPPERVRVLSRDAVSPKPTWAELIAAAIAEAKRIGAVMLVIDTFSFWAQFEGERENWSGEAQRAMDRLDEAAREELLVLLVHHQGRAGAPRGSTALEGALETVIELERLEDDAPSHHRRLVAQSRWPQVSPVLVLDFVGGEWRLIGEADSRHGAVTLGIREEILAALPTEPPGPTEDELAKVLDKDRRKVADPLRELLGERRIAREGKGKKGDPYRYWRPSG